MINFKYDTSNNISFPDDDRKVMIVVDGEHYFRIVIDRDYDLRYDNHGNRYLHEGKLIYKLFKEDRKEAVCKATLHLISERSASGHTFAEHCEHREIPDDFFYLERIDADENLKNKGYGTVLLTYIIEDIVKFNKLQDQTIKLLFERVNNPRNISFYDKVGVRTNAIAEVDIENDFCTPVIIDKPKIYDNINIIECADNFKYELEGYENPFTKSKTLKK